MRIGNEKRNQRETRIARRRSPADASGDAQVGAVSVVDELVELQKLGRLFEGDDARLPVQRHRLHRRFRRRVRRTRTCSTVS